MGAIYKIGSFNVHNLSMGVNRDMERIAKIIKENDLDVFALQEILSEGRRISGYADSQRENVRNGMFNRSLMRYLGQDWEYYIGTPVTRGGDKRGESYAFLWNTKRIELPTVGHKTVYPTIWDSYHLKEQGLMRLARDPLVGRFKAKNRKVEFRLITTHIAFGKPAEDDLEIPIDFGDLTLRRNEFKILAGDIYARISDHRRDMDSIVPYTIILGDYNLNLSRSGVGRSTLAEVVCFDKKGVSVDGRTKPDRVIHTVQHDLTTLQMKDGHARDGYASNYDHFSYEDRVGGVVRGFYSIDAVHGTTMRMSEQSYLTATQQPSSPDSPFEVYLQNVSDHLPIVIELDL